MYENSLPLLSLSSESELSQELSQSHVQRVSFEVEVAKVLLCHCSTKIVTETTTKLISTSLCRKTKTKQGIVIEFKEFIYVVTKLNQRSFERKMRRNF